MQVGTEENLLFETENLLSFSVFFFFTALKETHFNIFICSH